MVLDFDSLVGLTGWLFVDGCGTRLVKNAVKLKQFLELRMTAGTRFRFFFRKKPEWPKYGIFSEGAVNHPTVLMFGPKMSQTDQVLAWGRQEKCLLSSLTLRVSKTSLNSPPLHVYLHYLFCIFRVKKPLFLNLTHARTVWDAVTAEFLWCSLASRSLSPNSRLKVDGVFRFCRGFDPPLEPGQNRTLSS